MRISRNHFKLFFNSLHGNIKKIYYGIVNTPALPKTERRSPEIIVSLTSYGRRVDKTVYYTLLSILRQTVVPDKIILWLDSDNWNCNKLPLKLKKLQELGVDINFCEDIRSYKKLIPSLERYQNSIIITVDDDVIYSPYLIETLYEAYLKDPKAIYCTRGYGVKFLKGRPEKYKKWRNIKDGSVNEGEILFPVGIGGILYPPNSLHIDVTNERKFKQLCPSADDIWFWYMAKLKGTPHKFVSLPQNYYSFDAIYQALHKGSALTHSNVNKDNNDIQLKNVLDEYKYRNIR